MTIRVQIIQFIERQIIEVNIKSRNGVRSQSDLAIFQNKSNVLFCWQTLTFKGKDYNK